MNDSYNAFYDLPVVRHGEVDAFDPRPASLAIHEVACGDLTIPAMIRMEPGEYLTVICHGAIDRTLKQLPFFQRVTTSLERPGPFVLFSDPVLALDPKLRLAWFAGTAQTEIVPAMLAMVRRVCNNLGIDRVSFQGSSGGGFASLQLSVRWPGSLAYVWSPQTDAMRFYKSHIRDYLAVAFPGLSKDDASARFPERLSCVEAYRQGALRNFIYYAQNTQDEMHLTNHCDPFLRSIGAETTNGIYLDGRVQVAKVNQGPGHGGPSQAGWDRHLERALTMWRG